MRVSVSGGPGAGGKQGAPGKPGAAGLDGKKGKRGKKGLGLPGPKVTHGNGIRKKQNEVKVRLSTVHFRMYRLLLTPVQALLYIMKIFLDKQLYTKPLLYGISSIER